MSATSDSSTRSSSSRPPRWGYPWTVRGYWLSAPISPPRLAVCFTLCRGRYQTTSDRLLRREDLPALRLLAQFILRVAAELSAAPPRNTPPTRSSRTSTPNARSSSSGSSSPRSRSVRGCGAREVAKTHRCKLAGQFPQVERQTATVTRWYWQEPFNPDSPTQILAWLKHHGHPVGTSKATDESTDRQTLERNLASTGHPFYRTLLDWRAVKKVESTYVEGTLRRLDKDDRLHPRFTFRPSTQRLSATAPNIQNVIADRDTPDGKPGLASGYRACIVARDTEPVPTDDYLARWR